MATFRTTLLFVVLVLVLFTGVYFAVDAGAAGTPQASQAFVKDDLSIAAHAPAAHIAEAVAACTRSAAWLSTQDLKDMLNARYEHRVHLPR